MTRLIIVGGFLGAGKTTLLLQAARHLTRANYRVGLITNNKGEGLVDTALAKHHDVAVTEVAGGCFCCRFPPPRLCIKKRLPSAGRPTMLGAHQALQHKM